MKRNLTPLVMIALVLAGTTLSSSGCRKKKDTIAKVHVRDAAGNQVSGATVTLSSSGEVPGQTSTLYKTATTNGSGEAIFDFNDVYKLGQAGVVVADINAEKDGMHGSGIIKVEQEETTEEKVFLNP